MSACGCEPSECDVGQKIDYTYLYCVMPFIQSSFSQQPLAGESRHAELENAILIMMQG
jgi:hypothetical protein